MTDDVDFININEDGFLPDSDEFIGEVETKGVFSTRIGPNKYAKYDGRLIQRTSVTADDADEFRRSELSGHGCRSIVKGVLMKAPHLICAKTEVKLVEIMLQLSESARAIGKESLMSMFSSVPINRVLQALSMILNHDGDLERKHNAQFWQWKGFNQDNGDPVSRRERFLLTQWTRKASMSLTMSEKANLTRDLMGKVRSGVPIVSLQEMKKGKPHQQLTKQKIAAINTAA